LKDKVRAEAGIFRAFHNRTQEYGFEFIIVIGEMAVRLTECRDDLRHLKPKRTVCVGERGPMAMGVTFVPFGRVSPDLNALALKRSTIAGAANRARSRRRSSLWWQTEATCSRSWRRRPRW